MTLYEKIKSMSPQEMAGYLCSMFPDCEAVDNCCPGYDYCSKGHNGWLTLLGIQAPLPKED